VLGRPLIEDILVQVEGLGAENQIVTNQPEPKSKQGLPLYTDVLPDKGALGGIYSALYHSSQPHTLCLACDMPFVVRPLLDHLIRLSPQADAVVPRLIAGPDGTPEAEPFRAIFAHTCLAPIRAALDSGKMRVISFFSDVRIRFVDEPDRPLRPAASLVLQRQHARRSGTGQTIGSDVMRDLSLSMRCYDTHYVLRNT
jgi:molybdopterin-guanine dinucleotide biosynthesis protein A